MEIFGGAIWNQCNVTHIGTATTVDDAAAELWWLPRDRAVEIIRKALETDEPVLAGYVWPDGLRADAPTDREPVGESRYGDPVYSGDDEDEFAPAIEPYYIEAHV